MTYFDGIVIVSLSLLVLLAIMVSDNKKLDKSVKEGLFKTYILCAFINITEWLSVILNGTPDWTRWIHAIAKCTDYAITPFITIAFVKQVLPEKKTNQLILCLLYLNILFEIVSIFTGWTFYLDEQNVYHHGPLNIVYTVVYVIAIAYALYGFVLYGNQFRRKNRVSIFGILGLLIVGIILQEAVSSEIKTISICLSLMCVFLYIHLYQFKQMQNEDTMEMQEKMLNQDALTGLFSRYAYTEELEKLEKAPETWQDLTIFSVDVNGLKAINDTMGHLAGDELIKGAADCLKKVLRPYGKVYRTGGDEFIAITKMDRSKTESIVRDLNFECFRWSGTLVKQMSLSVGYVCASEYEGLNIERLISLADSGMYKEKERYYQQSGNDRRRR